MASVALGQKAVGSVVKLKFNGAMREFLVVHPVSYTHLTLPTNSA